MNKIKIILSNDQYKIFVDDKLVAIVFTAQSAVDWLEFNWPVGTVVQWIVVPTGASV
jgi:hypothetical protein